jgi:short-subunit dehydrogenase
MSETTILITGCTAGIGRAAALGLARKGHRVFATGRRESVLAELREEAKGTKLETLVLDVTDAASIEAARAEVDRRTGGHGVDALVNNAGFAVLGPAEAVEDSELRRQFDTNVFGLMAVTRAFLPAMRERGTGRIVNISSMAGRITFPMMGVYHSSKYALEALSDALRNEVAPFGVKVVLVEPGFIRTEFTERAMSDVDRFAASAYGPVMEKAIKVRDRFESTGVDASVVVRAIEKAIVSKRPRTRYVTPFSTYFVLALFRLMPTGIMDAILQSVFGLDRTALTSAKPAKQLVGSPKA